MSATAQAQLLPVEDAATLIANADEPTEMVFGKPTRIYARRPILATDCDYEIVTVSGVQGRRI